MNSQQRMLTIFLRLLEGKKVTKHELMEEFDKQSSTIQRDIGYIEEVLLNQKNGGGLFNAVNIERDGRGSYQLKRISDISNLERLTDTDILILLKILHSTRLFNQEEFLTLSNKLIATADNKDLLKQFIGNEQLHYQGISSEGIIEKLEIVMKAIVNHEMLEFSYAKNGNTAVFRRIPNAIYFSDLYFYMMSSSHTAQDDFELLAMNKFKIHSMLDIKVISSHNRVDYKDKFEGGVLRNQGVLPFLGNPITIVLDFYYDPIYVLDRFPNSKIVQENNDGSIRFSIQGNDGYGVKMWLLGQGHHVKVISPKHIRDYLIQNMKDTLSFYDIETDEK